MEYDVTKMTSTDKRMYLRRKRAELGLTQKQMAEILCIKPGTYTKYEASCSGTRNISNRLFEDMMIIIEQYEREHKGKIVGRIIISRYLEDNRDNLFLYFPTRNERAIANIMFQAILENIKDIENRAKVPYLFVRK